MPESSSASSNRIFELEDQLRQERATIDDIRKKCWMGHGHDGIYGDDGEMQCSRCAPWDYKDAPLEEVVNGALSALRAQLLQEREVNESLRNNVGNVQRHLAASNDQIAQLKEDRDTWMGQGKRANLQVALLQTTVGQLREALNHCGGYLMTALPINQPEWLEGIPEIIAECEAALGRDSACPAPAKEEE